MTDLDQILSGLIQRTEEGKLKWSSAAQTNRFTTSVDVISVEVFSPNPLGLSYRLNIRDESGELVESLGQEDTTRHRDGQLERLYVLARRSALEVDSVLEKLAQGLEL